MVKNKRYIFGLLLFFIIVKSSAQQALLDNIALQNIQRDLLLLDSNKQNQSFTIKYGSGISNAFTSKPKFKFLSFTSTYQSNSALGWGINDGSMHPSVGQSVLYTPAFAFNWKRLSIHIQPEFVYSDNKAWEGLPNDWDGYTPGLNDSYWPRFYAAVANIIEEPYRPYTSPEHQYFLGQSNIKFKFDKIAIGISNENLWWGPGIYNSLIMTNNAPGFLHANIQTTAPINTPIGSIEGQMIAGNLQNADIAPSENENYTAVGNYIPKPRSARYITGMSLSLQPKFVSNLYIGFATAAYAYKNDANGFLDYTPFNNWSNKAIEKRRPTMGSVFFRYVLPKDHAEIYVEYGRKDKAATFMNIFQDSIPTAYIAGFKKLFPLGRNGKNGAISLLLETAHLQLQNPSLLFLKSLYTSQQSWYTSPIVPQGYTNNGQIIGSGIGPGSNSQVIQLGWLKGLKKVSVSIERVSHNKDFYYYNYFNGLLYPGPNYKYWADLIYSLSSRWNWRYFIFAGEVRSAKSFNYKWSKTGMGGIYGPSNTDRSNLQFVFSIKYQNLGFKKPK